MKRFATAMLGVFAAVVFAASQASAAVSVYYAFTNTAGVVNYNADTGSSLSSFSFTNFNGGVLQSFAGTTVNAQPGFAASNTASINKVNADGSDSGWFQFTLNATGLQDIKLSWASARSSSSSNLGIERWVLQYSTDGGSSFITWGTNSLAGQASNAFVGFTNDLSSVTALNNNSSDVFRILAGGSGINTGGTGGLDNFTVETNALVPEPSTVFLVGSGLLGLLAIRRRRS